MTPPDDRFSDRTLFVSPEQLARMAAPADAVGHYLVVVAGAEPGRRVEVGPEPITIGRDAQQTLVFADAELSRRHARIWLENGRVMAADLGSTNGTFVDHQRLTAPQALQDGSVLRAGSQLLKYERRSRRDVERSEELDRELQKARSYVLGLLPPPLGAGPVRTAWCYAPSAQLAGDAFGYDWLDPATFVFYLVDVSGHGVGSAMHSVTVMNVLRQRALPQVRFENPADVLASLNDRFQMDEHNGMYFTMWYGVYRTTDRTLTYASAGHHAAYLVPPERDAAQPHGMPALMIGAIAGQTWDVAHTTVAPGSTLYVFSDGVFEIVSADQRRWELSDFLPLLLQPPQPGMPEPDRLYAAVTQAAAGPLDDDFSLLTVTFP